MLPDSEHTPSPTPPKKGGTPACRLFNKVMLALHVIEQFSINQNQSNISNQSQRMQSNPVSNQTLKQLLHETQENLRKQVTIGFDFTRDWFWFYF